MTVSTMWAFGVLGYCLTGGEPLSYGFEWANVGRSFFFTITNLNFITFIIKNFNVQTQ